ncbi:hypothetical protein XELAEV_18008878mg [Xenopus laevis]|uniref:Uncharacterized protein n=1 Tax=Xenopus laevis TaxID=8355 RepID=A0A974DRP1_XENLA|nr:hypothetical protein XELAEV_18008878mg [Xenopus laevis]
MEEGRAPGLLQRVLHNKLHRGSNLVGFGLVETSVIRNLRSAETINEAHSEGTSKYLTSSCICVA